MLHTLTSYVAALLCYVTDTIADATLTAVALLPLYVATVCMLKLKFIKFSLIFLSKCVVQRNWIVCSLCVGGTWRNVM